VAERERRHARPRGTQFIPRSQLLSRDDVARAVRRMAHEVVERGGDLRTLYVVGLQTGGVPFAELLTAELASISSRTIDGGTLDVAFYRDDVSLHPVLDSAETTIDTDLTERTVLLVDDVLYTGRTIRAALNALSDWGRPQSIQLAVMVDRGHRELPIRPDYVGKNLPTSHDEAIDASLDGVWIGTLVAR
jgi:pyrimidine operon attenuation protein / uracil phosphoribosyltransferase